MKQFQCLQNVFTKKSQPTASHSASSASSPASRPDCDSGNGVRGVVRDRIARVARVSSSMRARSRAVGDARDGVDDEFKRRRPDGRVVRAARGRAARRDAAPGPAPGVRAPPTRSSERAASGTGAFVDYGVYKTKGALKLKAVRATFESDASGRRIMKRAGGVLLELANATAPRQYDWGNKGSFMLSATEAAELADRMASNAPCSFFHDPGAGGANRGNVSKAFKVEPMPDGSGGLFVNLQTTSGGNKSFVSVPVSYGESAALRHILVYLVPKIAGFDEVFRE